jgi:hypothetical protein
MVATKFGAAWSPREELPMSKRARSARRLASLLSAKSGTDVTVHYDRRVHRYRVVWTDGPNAAQMYGLAASAADSVPELDVFDLLWHRNATA